MIEVVAHTSIEDQPPSYEDVVNNNLRLNFINEWE